MEETLTMNETTFSTRSFQRSHSHINHGSEQTGSHFHDVNHVRPRFLAINAHKCAETILHLPVYCC